MVSEKGAELLYEKAYNVTARKNADDVKGLKDDEALKVYVEAFKDAVDVYKRQLLGVCQNLCESAPAAILLKM